MAVGPHRACASPPTAGRRTRALHHRLDDERRTILERSHAGVVHEPAAPRDPRFASQMPSDVHNEGVSVGLEKAVPQPVPVYTLGGDFEWQSAGRVPAAAPFPASRVKLENLRGKVEKEARQRSMQLLAVPPPDNGGESRQPKVKVWSHKLRAKPSVASSMLQLADSASRGAAVHPLFAPLMLAMAPRSGATESLQSAQIALDGLVHPPISPLGAKLPDQSAYNPRAAAERVRGFTTPADVTPPNQSADQEVWAESVRHADRLSKAKPHSMYERIVRGEAPQQQEQQQQQQPLLLHTSTTAARRPQSRTTRAHLTTAQAT